MTEHFSDHRKATEKEATRENMEKRSGERNAWSYGQISQQQQDVECGFGRERQGWMEITSLWLMLHRERRGTGQDKSNAVGVTSRTL